MKTSVKLIEDIPSTSACVRMDTFYIAPMLIILGEKRIILSGCELTEQV